MIFGLTDSEMKLFEKLCIQPLKQLPAQVWVFGSRARGDHRPASDIDILYKAKNDIRMGDIGKINEALEESRLPYKVDLVNIKNLAESYKENVLKDRVEL